MAANGLVTLVGAFGGTGVSENRPIKGGFTVSFWGTFTATAQLQRSYDNGTTWIPVALSGVTPTDFTAPVSVNVETPADGVLHRLQCTAYTSGTMNYRIDK